MIHMDVGGSVGTTELVVPKGKFQEKNIYNKVVHCVNIN